MSAGRNRCQPNIGEASPRVAHVAEIVRADHVPADAHPCVYPRSAICCMPMPTSRSSRRPTMNDGGPDHRTSRTPAYGGRSRARLHECDDVARVIGQPQTKRVLIETAPTANGGVNSRICDRRRGLVLPARERLGRRAFAGGTAHGGRKPAVGDTLGATTIWMGVPSGSANQTPCSSPSACGFVVANPIRPIRCTSGSKSSAYAPKLRYSNAWIRRADGSNPAVRRAERVQIEATSIRVLETERLIERHGSRRSGTLNPNRCNECTASTPGGAAAQATRDSIRFVLNALPCVAAALPDITTNRSAAPMKARPTPARVGGGNPYIFQRKPILTVTCQWATLPSATCPRVSMTWNQCCCALSWPLRDRVLPGFFDAGLDDPVSSIDL